MRRLIPFALTALILVHAVAAMAQTCCGWCGIPAPVAKTGQKTCYDASGAVISCSGTGQDGDIQSGVGWPVPRFTDNLDGTVTDNLTGLIWLKDANCFGVGTWTTALSDANGLSSGECGLTDGSVAGDWRLPSVNELQSLINYEYANPALSNTTGDGQWVAGDPFMASNIPSSAWYHTSTSRVSIAQYAWMVNLNDGHIQDFSKTTTTAYYVWPVRVPTAQDDEIFFDNFESGDCCGWCGIPAPVAKTGQKTCYDASGAVISCSGTGQDGDIQSGVGRPVPRFTDNLDGTVTDNLTGLIWLKDANCFGVGTWTTALGDANGLASGECGLTDGSVAGDWRLPSVNELQSLINYEYANPALSNTTGDGQWVAGDPFLGADNAYYHTSTSRLTIAQYAWMVNLNDGHIQDFSKTTTTAYYVWPVRGP